MQQRTHLEPTGMTLFLKVLVQLHSCPVHFMTTRAKQKSTVTTFHIHDINLNDGLHVILRAN